MGEGRAGGNKRMGERKTEIIYLMFSLIGGEYRYTYTYIWHESGRQTI